MADGNIRQWGGYELEAADEDEQALSKGASEFMKFKNGRNVVRVLPPLFDETTGKPRKLIVNAYEHYIEVPGAERALKATCPRLMAKSFCPICQLADQLATNGNPVDAARAKKYAARKRCYINVIDRSDPDAGPKVAAIGKQIAEQLVAIRKDEDAGGDFTDPENGFDLVIMKNLSRDDQISYKVVPARNASPLGNEDWILAQSDLGRFAQPDTAEEIQRRMEETQGLLVATTSTPRKPRVAGGGTAVLPPSRGRRPAPARTAADDLEDPDAASLPASDDDIPF